MGEVYMGKLILTARGLNSETGQKIIRKCLTEEGEREKKTILLISIKEYRIDEILKQASIELGFTDEHIFLASGQIDLKTMHPDYIYVTEGNVYQVLDYMRKNGLLKLVKEQMKRADCTYIGSSAGAMIAGTDIYLAEDFDENIVGLTDLKALGLFDGSVIPHYSGQNLKCYIKNSNQEDMEGAYKKQLASQKNQNLEIKNETDLEKYLKREYQDKKEKFLVQEKIRLLREIKKLLKEQGLNSILESIRKENDDYQNVLRELSGEYGGTPEQQTVPNVSEQITVNEPVEFVLRKLQMDLNILDAEMLRQFLNRVTEIMPHKHLLGRINDQYRDLEEITVKLLLQPEMIGNPTIVGIINNWPVSTNALYRNNTFYVISSRRYTSELAINDYSRG